METITVPVDRMFQRSLSNGGNSSNVEPKEVNISRRCHRTSEHCRETTAIEEMVTCAIHLGIMESPRKLKCQHAFCTDCLIDLVKSSEKLSCPICRSEEPSSDVLLLPRALVEMQLIEVVMQQRIAKCTTASLTETSLSKENKVELVKHLLKELKKSSSAVFRFSGHGKNPELSTEEMNYVNLPIMTSASSLYSSAYDMLDVGTIREHMLAYSSYTDVKRRSIKKFCKSYQMKKHCTTPTDLVTFDVHLLKNRTESYEIVFVDSNTDKIFVYSEIEFRNFSIHVEAATLKVSYIRIFQNDLYVTGVFSNRGTINSIFLQCNMYGRIIRKSEICPNFDSTAILPMMYGFDIDVKHERYFVCMPHMNCIKVFNPALVECRQSYGLSNNRPEFVTFCPLQNQIWISCPEDRQILIADLDTGAFMMFRTDQIDEAVPQMIFCTDEERIIFLDRRSNRFIWIKRRGDYILTQKLNFRSIVGDLNVRAFQVLPMSLIVVGTSTEFLVFQPVRMKSKLKGAFSPCVLL